MLNGIFVMCFSTSGLQRTSHGERPEELLGHREPRQQALIVLAAGEAGQAPRQLALRRARRPQQQQVLAAQRRQEQQPHLRSCWPADEALAQRQALERRPACLPCLCPNC